MVRPAVADDRATLRQAVVELQEHERRLHATRLPAAHIADAYLDWMLARAECDGAVLVAEQGGAFAGFVAGWIEQADAVAETADSFRMKFCMRRVRMVGSGCDCGRASLAAARHSFAEELRFGADVRSLAVVEVFARVPRERFVGGAWRRWLRRWPGERPWRLRRGPQAAVIAADGHLIAAASSI